jgi:hypothetical protein
MTIPRPVRIHLSRRKGFDLRAWSREVNGLDVVNCARPGKWGNPFYEGCGLGYGAFAADGSMTRADVRLATTQVRWFRHHMEDMQRQPAEYEAYLTPLRGKNLACWCLLCGRHFVTGRPFDEPCPDCAPCHVDVLGELANAPICEDAL